MTIQIRIKLCTVFEMAPMGTKVWPILDRQRFLIVDDLGFTLFAKSEMATQFMEKYTSYSNGYRRDGAWDVYDADPQ